MESEYARRRLKQKDLVMSIFFLFEQEYERSQAESIWEIRLPIERIKQELEAATSVHYRTSLWIYTQLRRYEEELGAPLFRKEGSGRGASGSFSLSIHDPMRRFHQKQHLYVSAKIRLANGAHDKILNETKARRQEAVRLYLGAGSTIFHLANLIAESSCRDPIHYRLHTPNLGVLKRLLEPPVDYRRIELITPRGQVDPDTYTILGDDRAGRGDDCAGRGGTADLELLEPFDYVVNGTSYLVDGELYVESAREAAVKGEVLRRARGEKILLLTMHELAEKAPAGLKPYGALRDYDYVVTPRHHSDNPVHKTGDRLFEGYRDLFVPQIIHWNYTILKVR